MNARRSGIFTLFCEEPYRIFFPLGVLIGAVGVSHWLFYALGWQKVYSGFFHSSIQMQGYMACFIGGFLMTAMPRFSSTFHATGLELLVSLAFILADVGFLFRHWWIAAEVCFILWLLTLARFAIVRIVNRKSSVHPPVEFVWIPIAIIHGIVGALLLIFFQGKWLPLWVFEVGDDMMGQGFVLAMVAGVGGFLSPRLMGRYDVVKPSEVCSMEDINRKKNRRVLIHALAGLIVFSSFWFEVKGFEAWSNGVRALVITSVLVWTRSLPRPPRTPGLFVKLVWLSMWMVILGSWLTALFPAYKKAMLHFMFIGGFSLMTFAIATMVVLSHGGESEKLQRSLPILWMVAIGIAIALSLRSIAVFFTSLYFNLLGTAAVFWILVAVSWLCFIAPKILKVPKAGSFERNHEQMKERVMQLNH